MNFLTDELRYIIRKVYMMNDANARSLVELGMQEGRDKHNHEEASMYCAKAQGLWYANATLQGELEKAGLLDILKGVHT